MGKRLLREEEGGPEIDAHDIVKHLFGHLFKGSAGGDTRIVDEGVDAAECIDDLLDAFLQEMGIGQVSGYHEALGMLFYQFTSLGQLLKIVASEEHQFHAGLREFFRNGAANAAACSSEEDDSVF